MLDLEAFIATRRRPTDEDWEELITTDPTFDAPPPDACHVYADTCLIHEHGGEYWLHAWWYRPIAYPTLADAEMKLYSWYQEFADA